MNARSITPKFVLLLLSMLFAMPAMAAMSYPISYQGKFLDSSGAPANGSFAMVFKLYDAATGGNQIGSSSSLSDVKVTDGLFSVAPSFAETSFDGNPRYLEITIGDKTLPERAVINWAPRAVYAATAGSVSSIAWGAIAGAPASLPPAGPAGGSLTGSYPNPGIADNVIGSMKLASDINSLSKVSGGAMTANPLGFVGIGTSDPKGPLDVYGRCKVDIAPQQIHNGTVVSSDWWQSFTATSNTVLIGVSLFVGTADSSSWNGQLALYSGEGIGGNPISSVGVNGAGLSEIIASPSASITAGNKYTFRLTSNKPLNVLIYNGLDLYEGGSYMGQTNMDAKFHVYVLGEPTSQLVIAQNSEGSGYNVGIGTTSPQARLHIMPFGSGVGSGILIGGTNPGDTNLQIFLSSQSGGYSAIQSTKSVGTAGGDFILNPNGGNVGIGTVPYYTLQVNGSVAGTAAYVNLSDGRYKKNIMPLGNALDRVMRLRGVSFDWDRTKHPEWNLSSERQVGFIAQEVQKVLPEAVSTDRQGTLSIAYSTITPLLVEAIKEQQKQIDQQKQAIAKVKQQNEKLRDKCAEIDALKSQVSAIATQLDQSSDTAKVVEGSSR